MRHKQAAILIRCQELASLSNSMESDELSCKRHYEYIYIYLYIYLEREREREGEIKTNCP